MCDLCVNNPFVDWHALDPQEAGTAAGGSSNGTSVGFNSSLVDQLDSGSFWYTSSGAVASTISYGFTTSNAFATTFGEAPGWSAFTAAQKTATREIMKLWDDLIAPSLVESTGSANTADIKLSNTTTDISYAHAYFPGQVNSEASGYDKILGSVWLNSAYSSGVNNLITPTSGAYGYMAIMHEIGHSLGLNHGGNYNGGSPAYGNTATGWLYTEDSRQFTIMSYFNASATGANWAGKYAQTPMVYDIMAIQQMYGADYTTRAGDTVYGFNSTAGSALYNFNLNITPILTIWDGNGIDTLDLSGWSTSSTITLTAGSYSSVNGMTKNLAIAYDVDIENATTGSGNDNITGNDLGNVLTGNGGADTINGAGGNDTINGGAGVDILTGGTGNDTIYFDALDNLTLLNGGSGFDTLIQLGILVAFDYVGHSFEQLLNIISDMGSAVWAEQTDYYDVNGLHTETEILYDDGTRSVTEYDTYNTETWSEWTVTYDASGNFLSEVFVPDDGLPPNTAPAITSNGAGATAAVNVVENSTAVTTVTASDTDAGTVLAYSIVGGADAARFTINATTGVLSFVSAPNFELSGDAGANNVYDVQVQVSDGTLTDTQTIAVKVTNQNEAPAITSNGGGATAAVNVVENSTAVTTVTASDPDAGATRTYSIVGGADAARFTINATTGLLSFVSAPNTETPTDAGANNIYDVQVQVSDGTLTDTQSIAVTVTNQNEAPAITSNGGGATAAVNVVENSTAVTTVTASDPDAGATRIYSIIGGADAARFTINATTGALSFVSAPNFELPDDAGANNIYDVQVQVSDGTLTDTQTIAVKVTNQNEAPAITSNGGGATAAVNVVENSTAVTTVTASDTDAGTVLAYSIVGGADAARFTINAVTGALSFVTAPNTETPTDAGANNIYDVQVQVSDGTLTDTQSIAVTVTNQNEAPAITSNGGGATAAVNVVENSTAVTTVTASDPDAGATRIYSIIGGADAARFTINATTGVLSFVSAPNFELPDDAGANNIYDVQVQVSDGTLTDTQTIAVKVTNQNEAPAITSNGGGATAAVNVVENSTAVTTVTASDPDAGATRIYSIIGGADAARFTINAATGALSFVTAPNTETPTDAGANNIYDVQVQVSDGTLTDTQSIAVTVTNQNEAPAITSNGAGATAAVNVVENSTAVTTVTASDPDAGATRIYSIIGGADAARFTINAVTGALSFVTAPNTETPTDAGANNVYDVQVQVSDGTLTDTQTIAVTVTNQNEAPAITSNGAGATAAVNVVENSTAVTTVTASDTDAGTVLAYSIVGGADAARFTINATTGALSFVSAPNFELPDDAGANNIYDVQVQVSDGTLTDTQTIAVKVTNQNEAPAITSNGGGATAAVNVVENSTAVTTVTASDPDAGATRIYSIIGGADAARFTINAATGALSFVSAPNTETPTDAGANNIYDVQVQVSDGTLTDTQSIAVTVTNQNEAPAITSNGAGATAAVNVVENSTAVTTVTASDTDAGTVLAYSIVGGADAARFTINAVTGALSFVSAPNFELPDDAGANNIYDVQVQVSDGTLTDTQTIAVKVTNQNEAPAITSNGGGATAAVNVVENSTAVTTVTASDTDAGTVLAYSIVGGADAARFTINAATGALSFVSAPNTETPTDAGANNIYDVQVQVSDGTLTDTQSIAVTVTNQNEAPAITSNGAGATAAVNVVENSTAVTTVTASDTDAGTVLAYSIVGGADAARFTINATTGVLSFVSAPNFELPDDAGANNIYDVQVQVSDGTLTDTQTIAVKVTNQNEAPAITSNGGGATAAVNVVENSTAVTTVTASDPDAGATRIYSIIDGADAARFTINATTGVLSFVSAPNFELPDDAGANNIYDVQVQVSDGTLTDTQSIAVTVTNQNEAPAITSNGAGATAAVNVVENSTAVTTVTASDTDAGTVLAYSIVGGADAARFTINAVTGALSFVTAPNTETPTDAGANNIYDVQVQVSDGTLTDTQSIAVTVTNQNEAPAITSNGAGATAAVNVVETSTAVTTVTASDTDAGTVLAYSIVGGADAARFTINATTGVLSFVSAPNFELPDDAGANNIYDVQVQVSDGTLTDTQTIAVKVTNQNEAPAITSNGGGATAAVNVVENSTAVTTVTASDPDAGATRIYSIIGGADAARFTINAATGALSFVTAPNTETPTDAGANNIYDVQVQVSDGTLTDTQSIAVTVTNQNEAPAITSNGAGATAAVNVVENSTAVTTVTASDTDAGTVLAYSIVGGADAARFTINAVTGALSFVSAPNFELPDDAGANNIYDVQVQVSDGTLTDTQTIAVKVTNQNEAPAITSNGGGATAAVNVVENSTAVTTVTASDTDAGTVLAYSIVGGADAARFTINAATGALSFVSAPNTETPTDAGANNIYDVQVQVSDGTLTDTQSIAVTVTNQNEAPAITSNGGGATAAISISENGTAVTTVTASDTDAGTVLAYSIVGGADAARFNINATTGVLSFVSAPDFELPGDAGANNVYDVQVQVSDGTLTDTQTIAVTVTNQNEAPAIVTAINGTSSNNVLTGTAGLNVINGFAGNDSLAGLGGADTLIGGQGTDTATYVASAAGVNVSLMTGLGSGGDAQGDTLSTIENLTGSGFSDILEGNGGNNVLTGGLGIDTVSYAHALAGVKVNLSKTKEQNTSGAGTDTLSGFENLTGSAFNDTLTGNTANNTLRGLAGNDTLNGGLGADTMIGGTGDDTYVVDTAGDIVDETGGSGTDTVQSSFAFSLAALGLIENLTLTGSAAITGTGNNLNNVITGNSGANTLTGLGGNDTLNGGAGADTMIGGTGNDTYVVDNAGDIVDETGGSGTDTVQSSMTLTLAALGLIENLTLTGSAAINGTGNDLNNVIAGNNGNNILAGLGGADTLIGGQGTDTAAYAASAAGVNVSLMTGLGSGGDAQGDTLSTIENLTGSGFSDTLEGNGGNNVLTGGLGVDTVSYEHSLAGVKVNLSITKGQNTSGAGTDTLSGFENLTGSAFNDTLTGNTANNTLRGLAGNDILTGGSGSDAFDFSSLVEGSDVITDFVTDLDHIDLVDLLDSVGLGNLDYATLVAQGNLVIETGNYATGTNTNSAKSLDTRFYVDADGFGAGSSVLIATLEDTLTNAGDFLV